MGILDSLLSEIGGNFDVANLAAKVGLSQEQIEQAVAALGQSHTEPGDTVEGAAQSTGLPTDKLQEIVSHIGGEGSLARYAQMLGGGGEGGEGIAGQISGLAGKIFGR